MTSLFIYFFVFFKSQSVFYNIHHLQELNKAQESWYEAEGHAWSEKSVRAGKFGWREIVDWSGELQTSSDGDCHTEALHQVRVCVCVCACTLIFKIGHRHLYAAETHPEPALWTPGARGRGENTWLAFYATETQENKPKNAAKHHEKSTFAFGVNLCFQDL